MCLWFLAGIWFLRVSKVWSGVCWSWKIADIMKREKLYGSKSLYSWRGFYFLIWHNILVAQRVKNLSAVQETWVWSLGQEDPLEKEMAAHSSFLAWRIPRDRGAWLATVRVVAESQTWLTTDTFLEVTAVVTLATWYRDSTVYFVAQNDGQSLGRKWVQ